MSETDERALAMRAAFDAAFAAPPEAPPGATEAYLRVRVGGEPYAIALAEVAALHVDLHVVPVPSPAPELLGVAAVRAAIFPIYDLRRILGLPATAAPRWVLLARGGAAFACDGFDGHAEAPAGAGQVVSLGDRSHPIVSLASLLDGIKHRWKET